VVHPEARRNHSTWIQASAIGLLSLSALSIEITLTTLLSVVEWYHFAFMVVSIALFGYAAAGVLLSLRPSLRERSVTPSVSAAMAGVSYVASIYLLPFLRFDPILASVKPIHAWVILAQYVVIGLPFFWTGMCIATLLTRSPDRANSLYFGDLTGAAMGCLLALVMIPLGGPRLPIVAAVSSALFSCFLLLPRAKSSRRRYLAFGVLAACLLTASMMVDVDLHVSPYKSLSLILRQPGSERIWTDWSSLSRIDAVKSSMIRFAPGLPFDQPAMIPEQIGLTVDGDDLDPITRFDADFSALSFMNRLPLAVPYEIQHREKVLVIDGGGGFDVLAGLVLGASEIFVTEKNPGMVKAVKKVFADFSGNLYSHPSVKIRVTDARSFLSRSGHKFDLIDLSLKKSQAAVSTGFYSLSENYLLTVEAFRGLISHLSDSGFLIATRWLAPPPREIPRILCVAVTALEKDGVEDSWRNIACFRSYMTVTLMVKRSPLEDWEIERLKQICKQRRFDLVYYPGISRNETNRFNLLDRPRYYEIFTEILDRSRRDRFLRLYPFDLNPPTDEKPFFFDFMKWSRIGDLKESLGPRWNPYLQGGLLLLAILLQSTILSVVALGVPIGLLRREREGYIGMRYLAYFLLLGAAFMLVEVSFLQKFILLVGSPPRAMAASLFGMLTFSGMGSLYGRRLSPHRKTLLAVFVSIVAVLAAEGVILRSVSGLVLRAGDAWRFFLAVLMVAPAGFVMGLPFPMGIRILGLERRSSIPLAYAANGSASVIGSAGSLLVGSMIGFSNVFILSGVAYAIAGLLVRSFTEEG